MSTPPFPHYQVGHVTPATPNTTVRTHVAQVEHTTTFL